MGRIYLKKNGAWDERNAELLYRKVNGQWVRGDWSELQLGKYRLEHLGFKEKIQYVSLGDSIAVGHRIDKNWEKDYGWDAQYGVGGRTETTLVPGCYTDIIRRELESVYGKDRVFVKSFARSGDKVSDLMDKLSHASVRSAIEQADLVTICIGANDVLHYALTNLEDYLATSDSSKIDGYVAESLGILNDDSNPNSYAALLNRLNDINPKAKYLFTTIYNPYKYLWLTEGSQRGSFFFHILNNIPRLLIDVDKMVEDAFGIDDLGFWNVAEWRWVSLELDIELGQYIKDGLLNTAAVKTLFKSVNAVGSLAEGYIAGNDRFVGLNPILRSKVNSYQAVNPNFALAETKKLYDLFPSRTDDNADVDYSDLVNVEFSKDYDVAEMDWGSLWRDDYPSAVEYWTQLAYKHLTFKNALPSTNAWDYVTFDLEGFAADLVADIVAKVIEPNIDPHPERQGHEVLKRSFSNVLGLVRYEANGGQCVPGEAVLAERTPKLTEARRDGYSFAGWYTEGQQPAAEVALTDYKASFTLSDLVDGDSVRAKTTKTTTLYAMWSD